MTSIKMATLEDLPGLAFLFDNYRKFYEQPSDLEGAKTFLQERIEKNESVTFIYYDEGRAVGFIQLYPIFSSVGMKKAWLLNDLYVFPPGRKKGVATALLEEAKKLGRETNAAWLLLSTSPANVVAKVVYKKNGWRKVMDIYYEFDLSQSITNISS